MQIPPVPEGLAAWDERLSKILATEFPPPDEPQRKQTPLWDKLSTWSLVCEEVLDTEPEPGLLSQYYEELLRRGFSRTKVLEMRHFAWLTAGWLNFEKMMWDEFILDEKDIQLAIDRQKRDGLITPKEANKMQKYLRWANTV